ncbi:MAG: hypothetical protein SGJ23_06915 [Alphaproteobacteria bacterium]|nr:hypothetical protein [Alphaproteobacteria bacterium]
MSAPLRRLILTAVLLAWAGAPAHAQTPKKACHDLAITRSDAVTSIPDAPPLAIDEVAFAWQVSNLGHRTYVAADENKQWLSLDVLHRTGPAAVQVLPPSGTGRVRIRPGASLNGYIRAITPPGTPLFLKINFAPDSGGGPRVPADCNTANNKQRVY